jgi:hypothetical protein
MDLAHDLWTNIHRQHSRYHSLHSGEFLAVGLLIAQNFKMALINCPECSKEVSDKAPACPNCGVVLNASSTEKVHSAIWGWWMGLLCLLGFAGTGIVIMFPLLIAFMRVMRITGLPRQYEDLVGFGVIGIAVILNCWLWWTIIRRRKKS